MQGGREDAQHFPKKRVGEPMKRYTTQSERNLLPIGIRRLKTRGVDVNHGILVYLLAPLIRLLITWTPSLPLSLLILLDLSRTFSCSDQQLRRQPAVHIIHRH